MHCNPRGESGRIYRVHPQRATTTVEYYLVEVVADNEFKGSAFMKLSRNDIDHMDKQYRAQFINGLSGFKPANLIGTIDSKGNTNLAIISSVIHLGAHPPLLAFINRPNSVDRHTLENILETRCFTINHLHKDVIIDGHQTSARYPRETSEFEACNFTEQWSEDFAAPMVKESVIKIGVRYVEHHTLLNQAVMVIGEINRVELPDTILRADGSIDIAAAHTVAIAGLDSYYGAELLARYSYAKPDVLPQHIQRLV